MSQSTRLPAPEPGVGVFEPYVAIDPCDPQRLAITAMYPNKGNDSARAIWCWRSADGGTTWEGGRIPQPRYDGEGAADAMLGYTPDGALVAIALAQPGAEADEHDARAAVTSRYDEPFIKRVVPGGDPPLRDESALNVVSLARSADHGTTWMTTIAAADGHKTSLAVDQSPGSPYRGHVYMAWMHRGCVAFARSVDGGRSAEPVLLASDRNGFAWTDIAVGRGGAVFLFWHWWIRQADATTPGVEQGIFCARSDDGGATFGEPVVIAEHRGIDWIGAFGVASSPDGALLAVWSEADEPTSRDGVQPRTTIRYIHSPDGERWSEPAQLTELSSEVAQGLPAVASTDGWWHVLSYDATATDTTVRLYRASHEELDFRPSHDLGRRGIGAGDICLLGSLALRVSNDIFIPGDFVGLAGAGSRVAAAFVLPATDDWSSELVGYAAVLDTR